MYFIQNHGTNINPELLIVLLESSGVSDMFGQPGKQPSYGELDVILEFKYNTIW